MSMCRVFSCVVGRGCLLWPVHSFGKTLLAFALLHSVLQGQICLLLQVFLDFLLLHSSQWHPTPVLLPRESHGRRSLVGYSPWGCTESDWSIYTQRHSQVWSLIHSLIHSIGYYLLSNYYVVKTILDAGSHLKQSHLRSTYNLERGCCGSLARGGKPGTSVAAANRVVPCLWWL